MIIWEKISQTEKLGECAPIEWFMAHMLLSSRKFHTEMKKLLDPFGKYEPAKMKGYERTKAKCGSDYSVQQLEKEGLDPRHPTIRHIKDCLVSTVRCTRAIANRLNRDAMLHSDAL